MAWVACAVVSATMIVALLVFGHYTRRERALGSLVPQDGLVRLSARDGGVVSEVLVSEGQQVSAGQTVLRISGDKSSRAMGSTGSGVAVSLALQKAALDTEIRDIDQIAIEQEEGLRRSEALVKRELGQFARQLKLIRQQSESQIAFLERIRPLVHKGYVSQVQVQQHETQALDSKAQIEVLMRQQAGKERELSDVLSEIAQLPASSESKQSELGRQRAQLEQATIENEAGRMNEVVSGSSGMISSLLAVVGQSVSPGEVLLAVVPAASPLEAHLMLPSSAIGFVRVGTRVQLHYVAFPYQKFGIQSGHVTQVSKSALSANEISALGGDAVEDRRPRYRVRVALDRQTIPVYNESERLLAGMSVEADILLDRRTFLEWLLEPLFGVRQRLREVES
jgi:membrane fusion protein